MIKAGSFLYAVFICFIIALLCGSIILIANLNHRIETKFSLEEELLITCNSSFNYYINAQIRNGGVTKNDFLDNGIISELEQKSWGLYKVVACKSYIKKDTVYKAGMIGIVGIKDNLALYLTDNDKTLHLSGKSSIRGDIKVSKYGVDYKHLQKSSSRTKNMFAGNQSESQKFLPKLIASSFINELYNDPMLVYDYYRPNLTLYNSFLNPTLIIDASDVDQIEAVNLKGNIILQSVNSLFISNMATLEDIIIDAPNVIFESYFSGTVQVFAKEKVSLEKGVTLKYPSAICINNDFQTQVEVYLSGNSTIIGGVVLTGKTINGSKNRLLTLEETSRIIGDAYCYGKTQLKGTIIGTLHTDQFYLKTSSSEYDNYILNGRLDALELPQNFIRIPLFKTNTFSRHELIKEL